MTSVRVTLFSKPTVGWPVRGIKKAHPGEQRLGRHLGGLCPACAPVVGEHDDAAVADRDQARAGRRDRDQERVRGEARGLGGQLGRLYGGCKRGNCD